LGAPRDNGAIGATGKNVKNKANRETRWELLATRARLALHEKSAKTKPILTRADCSSGQQSDWRHREKSEKQSQT
jgi:hypothetical protein